MHEDTKIYIMHLKASLFYFYVDDISPPRGPILPFINTLLDCLHAKFEIKDIGSLRFFLGIEVSRQSNGMYFSI